MQSEWVRDRPWELYPKLSVETRSSAQGDRILDTRWRRSATRGSSRKSSRRRSSTSRHLAVQSARTYADRNAAGLAIRLHGARGRAHVSSRARGRTEGDGPARGRSPALSDARDPMADLARSRTCPRRGRRHISLRRRSQLVGGASRPHLVDIRGTSRRAPQGKRRGDGRDDPGGAAGPAWGGRGAAAFAFSSPRCSRRSPGVAGDRGAPPTTTKVRTLVGHWSTSRRRALRAERALMAPLEGGCQVPIAALGELTHEVRGSGSRERP